MKHDTYLLTLGALALGATYFAPALSARSCSGNGDIIGSYGWAATRSAFAETPSKTPAAVSNTPVGALLAGATNGTAFSSTGRIVADGVGTLYGSATVDAAPGTAIGTYTINTDCTISIGLTDGFAAYGSTPATSTFEGVILDGGNEIALIQTAGAGGTSVTLQRAAQFGACTIDMVNGTYGVVAAGTKSVAPATGTTGLATITPFNLLGRFFADGAGDLVTDSPAAQSALKRNFTGSYTVNADCTGTLKLIDPDGKTTRNLSFVIVSDTFQGATKPEGLQMTFSDTGVNGSGEAKPQ